MESIVTTIVKAAGNPLKPRGHQNNLDCVILA